jgi:5-methylcytosine-specific restriction endonuclease McrA
MTYSEKLRSPRWQKKRLEILNRDGFRCVICGEAEKNLQVHHIVYRKRDPWDYPDYCYQTLCEPCHVERQELTEKTVDAMRLAVAKVPTERLTEMVHKICAEAMLEIKVEGQHAN